MTEEQKYLDYLQMLRKPFQKLCRLRFLQPDGSTAFMLDNRTDGSRAGTFIADGTITHNWQNGRRTSATVTLSNVDGAYDYNFNSVWFGTEIALDEGMILSDGATEFYIQQGVFLIETPTETVQPNERTVTYNLVDKTAALDGTLGGKLEGSYQVAVGTNIFAPITALLAEDKGNGLPVDAVTPVFTEFYNDRTQTLPDGTVVYMTDSPYTLTIDGTDGTIWDVISGLAAMVNGWVGYDETGALRIDPSQDDILDTDKPIDWQFSTDEAELLGMTYQVKNTEVYNDCIVLGEQLSDYTQPRGRARIVDPRSPVAINAIGRKTTRISQAGFGTNVQCMDYAAWTLKRAAVLQRTVSISCSQILHLHGNNTITLTRTDKQGSPTERHLIQGYSRPLSSNGAMTISAISVNDIPNVYASEYEDYLTFSSANDFTLETANGKVNWDGIIEYSTPASSWAVWDGTSISSSGGQLYLRGTNNTRISGGVTLSENKGWVLTGSNISCIGNIETLLDYTVVANGGSPQMKNRCFFGLFDHCTALTTAPALPATTLAAYCYNYMFNYCTALTTAPALPATTLAQWCYALMFNHCTSLASAPTLPATKMEYLCYYCMFQACSALTAAPALPATTLADSCYRSMFNNCTALITAPSLPANAMEPSCYYQMFSGCTALTTAPALPATTLADHCYYQMFYGCAAITTARSLPATTLADYCYYGMFAYCTSLTRMSSLPATKLTDYCYYGMFSYCIHLKVSSSISSGYTEAFRIPKTGTGTDANDTMTGMFFGTGGTFKGTPTINTTYYAEYRPVS